MTDTSRGASTANTSRRASVAGVLVVAGALAVGIAFVNLFNIDRQPAWLLLVYAIAGVALLVSGVQVWRRRSQG